MTVGFDSGDDDDNERVRPAWQTPKGTDLLTIRALKACNRVYFKTHDEQRRWVKIKDHILGGEERNVLYKAWMVHCIETAEERNAAVFKRIFPNLMTQIENDAARVDWEVVNRESVLTASSSKVKSRFAGRKYT